ncbi:hypothetical protein E3H47_04945 [Acinetobacter radioresistens]|uniref:hypothetical protein n=1 Tax=Acinetobacter radioresistens TaxID=40216 RepID=UPI0010CD64D1|nr:hypothetical protein [Acinetobacter radioresistens]QCS11889.1 hypothetical protein E3H47_04875 [Acinetobacter radioresistens]QCS11901.1 hypothetical protein E3H47_04945 [Acinetobacter radioresistens]
MDFLSQVLESVRDHAQILFTGILGATFGFLLSKESKRDRWIGFFAGFILCVVFAKPASLFLANGNYPELFGFVLGAAGKSTAEALLSLARSRLLGLVKKEDEDAGNHQ